MSGDAETRGVVRRIEGGHAVVAVAGAACGGCAHAGGCVAGRLATPAARLLTLPADAALAVGDAVRLTQPERSVTLSALLGYLFPALALLVGAWLGATLTGSDADRQRRRRRRRRGQRLPARAGARPPAAGLAARPAAAAARRPAFPIRNAVFTGVSR